MVQVGLNVFIYVIHSLGMPTAATWGCGIYYPNIDRSHKVVSERGNPEWRRSKGALTDLISRDIAERYFVIWEMFLHRYLPRGTLWEGMPLVCNLIHSLFIEYLLPYY